MIAMQPTIVGTGPIDDIASDLLKPFGTIVIAPDPAEACVMPLLKQAIGLIVRGGGSATATMIQAAENLKVIGRSGSGYESVDIVAANQRKIPVVYAPGLGARAVAEAAITFMLALCKNLCYWDRQMKCGNWKSRFEFRPRDLDQATLGIVGLGNIGQTLARLTSPFRMTLLAYDPYVSPDKAEELGVRLTSLTELLSTSDFISLHAPQMPETKAMINRERLRLVKRGAYFINLARGGLVESLDVLYDALLDGTLAGVALDVFEPEPPDVNHAIFKHPNCLTSPHVLGTSEAAMREVFRSMAEDMVAVLRGVRPRFVVNPESLNGSATVAVNHDTEPETK
jgi:D-3-phosphoglycerate dehydrogenase